jgi:hypothetical protein
MGRLWYGFLVICFVAQAGAAIAETTEERLQRLEQAVGDMKKHEARGRSKGSRRLQNPVNRQMCSNWEHKGKERSASMVRLCKGPAS